MPDQNTSETRNESWVRWLWRLFSSTRLAFIMMLIIIAFSLIGALVIQAPSDATASPSDYALWVESVAGAKYGVWAPLMSVFKFFSIFTSPWFLAAGALLMLNIIICSIDRWGRIRQNIRGSPVKQADSFYTGTAKGLEVLSPKMSTSQTTAASKEVFTSRHYRVRTVNEDDKFYIAADKNRYIKLFTYASHLSLILFIIGFLVGNFFGFRETSFIVAESTTQEVGYDTGLSLRLNSFTDEYYTDGAPKDYRSDVMLYEAGKEVRQATIQVNHPLSYNGVRFYQSFFGPAVTIQVRNSEGQEVYKDTIPLTSQLQSTTYNRYTGIFHLPNAGLVGQLISSATNVPDPMIKKGEVAIQLYQMSTGQMIIMDKLMLNQPKTIAGYEFTFLEDAQFSGFQVSKDPGNAIIWIASVLFVIGIGLVLYLPHRQIWAQVQARAGGGSRITLRTTASKGLGIATELEAISKDIEKALKYSPGKG